MINSEAKDLIAPLINEERLEIKEKHSLRILLFFTNGVETPETIEAIRNKQEFFEIEKGRGTHIIYAIPNDFNPEGLKPDLEIQEKYKKFREVDDGAKILLVGHGNRRSPFIWAEGSHPFNTSQIVSIFQLIQDPSVRVKREEFEELKSLPKKHLSLSVQICCGENFAYHLANKLGMSTPRDKRWVLSITTGKIDRLIFNNRTRNYKKSYLTPCSYGIYKITKPLMWIFALAFFALCIVIPVEGTLLENNETATKLSFASIAPGVLFCLCLAANILLEKYICNNISSNSKHKVVIHTNFEKDYKHYFTLLSKDKFKKLQRAEEVNRNLVIKH